VPSAPNATTGTLTITSGGLTVYKFTNFSGNPQYAYHASATTITDPQTGASVQAAMGRASSARFGSASAAGMRRARPVPGRRIGRRAALPRPAGLA
jgi:hypothetical protein